MLIFGLFYSNQYTNQNRTYIIKRQIGNCGYINHEENGGGLKG